MKISDTEKIEIPLAGLAFEVLCRDLIDFEGGDDGGTSIEIYGEVGGERTQVLRFDVFRETPHYHAPPSAKGQIPIEAAEGDPLEWSLARIRDDLPELLERAGYADLAEKVDRKALVVGVERIRDAAARSARAPRRLREF